MTIPEQPALTPDELTDEQVLAGLQTVSAIAARADTWDGYCGLYYALLKHWPDPYVKSWYEKKQAAWNEARSGAIAGVLQKAFRGAHKSTDLQVFMLQKIGIYPHLSHTVVAARDDDSKKIAKFVAETIEQNGGWKLAFPNVIPDLERGWNLEGYNVKCTKDKDGVEIPYSQWVEKVSHDHGRDASFMAVSAISGSIGSHPSGMLVLDDIHDDKNTVSDVEMIRIKNAIKSDVFGTMNRKGAKPAFYSVYTPKKPDDLNGELEISGLFDQINLPAFRYDPEGKDVWEGKKVTLEYGVRLDVMQAFRKAQGSRIFRREFLLDMTPSEEDGLLYLPYPAREINRATWIFHGGCDPSDTDMNKATNMREQSHFALAYVAELPTGGAVVVDGVLEQCTQLIGEGHIKRAPSLFPRWKETIVEAVGYGRLWFNVSVRDPELAKRIRKGDLKGMGFTDVHGFGKAERLEREMAPWFEQGVVKISDADTPFLNAFRKFFQEFKTIGPHDPAWDAADSVYQALKGMIHVLRVSAPPNGGLPSMKPKPQSVNPLSAMLSMNARGNR